MPEAPIDGSKHRVNRVALGMLATRITSSSGLRAELNANGSLRRFDCDAITLSLFVGNEIEGGPTNVYLRRHSDTVEWTPLLGPLSPTRAQIQSAKDRFVGAGTWLGINYSIALVLARDAAAWFWHVHLENTTLTSQHLDLIYAQDLAIAPYGAVRLNEYYVSQYIDHTPLAEATHGFMIASRQNQAVDGRNPWCLIGSLRTGASFATDALQFHGLARRAGEAPPGLISDLRARRLQHEHSMVVIRDAPIRLAASSSIDTGFFGSYVAHHPEATSPSDLKRVSAILALPEAAPTTIASAHVGRTRGAAPASGSTTRRAAGSQSDGSGQANHATMPNQTQPGAATPSSPSAPDGPATLFTSSPLLESADLDTDTLRALFGSPWRHEEVDDHGERLSFFYDADRHVVLRAKELRVLRPHGHLLRTGRHLTPDESALTSTVWMSGVFHSMLAQGHVSINRFLSTTHTYLGLFRSHGQRVFAEIAGSWQLLNVPSAFEMSPDTCRWIYRHKNGVIQVTAAARSDPHELTLSIEVSSGEPVRLLISHHIAMDDDDGSTPGPAHWRCEGDDIIVSPGPGTGLARRFPNGHFRIAPLPGARFQQVGGDELLFLDGRSRQQPYLCVVTDPTSAVDLRIRGHLIAEEPPIASRVSPGNSRTREEGSQLREDLMAREDLIPQPTLSASSTSPLSQHVARLADIVPWFTHNALVHYLSPRGLEQYSGGGWGTRDVCQGPVEMLLALGRTEPIRNLLLRVMTAQNPDGDWPQWFMFFERERDIRPGDSHGDIVFWPLVVLAQYLIASGDAAVLDERVPFFDRRGPDAGERATVWEHAQRALGVIEKRVIPGTALAAYGHGDWNDALQPADPVMRDHMCSAWTVTLHFQTLTALARALRSIGRAPEAARFETSANTVQRDFQRLLLVDGVLTGYALFDNGGRIRYLLHPRDETTGVQYSALAIIHAILEDMLTPAQVRDHLRLIDKYLSAPDGVRLFDRPMPYHGGPQRFFQRAESATFFGREIGLMYMHAHLRYAQALAHVGEAERFFHALCQANPIGIRSIVPSATLRQSNCYYSSSDAAFEDRYQASAEYERVLRGTIPLDGGWRVYSSGAGIALGLIMRRFLGLSCEANVLRVDPVIAAALDGLRVQTTLLGRPIEVHYRIGKAGCGVNGLILNDQALSFSSENNPHRRGAALIPAVAVRERLRTDRNLLTIDLG